MFNPLERAKEVLEANEAVRFGIFGQIGVAGLFPPQAFLNEFLMRGSDPCDQDRRSPHWQPFAVSPAQYGEFPQCGAKNLRRRWSRTA